MGRLRHLVVVIPGIGGSVLSRPGGGTDRYALTPAGLARTVVSPTQLDLDEHPDLVPTDLVNSATALVPLEALPGYQRLTGHLRGSFDDVVVDTYRPPAPIHPDTDVLKFPYDFRRSIELAAQRLDDAVGEALRHRPRASGSDRPVIIVAHSMGGLVARFWVAVLGGWRHCHAIISLGTPYRGAPKALDWLVNGAGRRGLRGRRATPALRRWPSTYELLPQYEAVWDPTGWADRHGAAVELTALPPALRARQRALADYAPTFAAMSAAGRGVHERMHAGWVALDPGQAPQLVPFLTRGHATLNLATLDGGRLRVSKQDPLWRGNVGWRGDGSVPMLCAIPRELGEREDLWRVRPERHGELASIYAAVQQLSLYEGEPVPTRGGPLPDRPWLGLDLDEFALPGVEIPVAVSLLPEGLTGGAAWVTCTRLDGASGESHRDRLTVVPPDEAGASVWRGVVPPQAPGCYEVALEVMGVSGPGSVAASATVVVLDPAAEADDLTDEVDP